MRRTPTASATTKCPLVELSRDSVSQSKCFLFEITYFIFLLVKIDCSFLIQPCLLCSSSTDYFTTLYSLQFKGNIFFVFLNC